MWRVGPPLTTNSQPPYQVKDLRAAQIMPDSIDNKAADAFSSRFGLVMGAVPILLNTVDIVHRLIGCRPKP